MKQIVRLVNSGTLTHAHLHGNNATLVVKVGKTPITLKLESTFRGSALSIYRDGGIFSIKNLNKKVTFEVLRLFRRYNARFLRNYWSVYEVGA